MISPDRRDAIFERVTSTMETCEIKYMLFQPSFSSNWGQRVDFWPERPVTPFFPPLIFNLGFNSANSRVSVFNDLGYQRTLKRSAGVRQGPRDFLFLPTAAYSFSVGNHGRRFFRRVQLIPTIIPRVGCLVSTARPLTGCSALSLSKGHFCAAPDHPPSTSDGRWSGAAQKNGKERQVRK